MKISDLRNIIREEIKNSLTEDKNQGFTLEDFKKTFVNELKKYTDGLNLNINFSKKTSDDYKKVLYKHQLVGTVKSDDKDLSCKLEIRWMENLDSFIYLIEMKWKKNNGFSSPIYNRNDFNKEFSKVVSDSLLKYRDKKKDETTYIDVFVITDPKKRGESKQIKASTFDDAMKKAISITNQVRNGKYNEKGVVGFIYVAGNDELGVTYFNEKYQDHLDVRMFGGNRSDFSKFHKLGYKVGTTGKPQIVKF